jgi:hypothetical protein
MWQFIYQDVMVIWSVCYVLSLLRLFGFNELLGMWKEMPNKKNHKWGISTRNSSAKHGVIHK